MLEGASLQGDVRLAAWSQREQPEWAFVHSRWGCVFPGLTGKKGWREEMTAGKKGAIKHDKDAHLVPLLGNK